MINRRFVALGLLIGTECIALIATFPDHAKEFARRHEPARSVYNRVFKPWYPFHRPDEIGHGGPAGLVTLQEPCSMVQTADEQVYFVDRCSYMWRVTPDNMAYVFSGIGTPGFPAQRMPDRWTGMGVPQDVTVGPDGQFYVADSRFHQILRVDEKGQVSRFAGTGLPGFAGDGGPAIEASFNEPFDLDFDSEGNLYIADFRNERIRVIDRTGKVSTVAGTGQPGYRGDGGSARNAMLNGPYGVAVDLDDRLLIADSSNHVIRRVAKDGTITTIVGTGERGFGGDGGPAIEALLDSPQEIAVTSAGEMYINDEHNHAIRLVHPNGTITTFIGQGKSGKSPSGTDRHEALLNDPEDMLVRRDGSLLIIDGQNRRILTVSPDGIVGTFCGR